MSTPIIAIIGRPNVGKSTLFNCLTKSREAIVSDYSGLTRDRQYGRGKLDDQKFIVIDTGGIDGSEEGIDSMMFDQTELAIQEADVLVFMVDAKAGVISSDLFLAEKIRGCNKPCILIANKIDGVNQDVALADFYQLGLGEPVPMAAAHNRGVRSFIQYALDQVKPDELDIETRLPEEHPDAIDIAIIGKPNVGKSTLVNRILGEERVIVYDMPGTTRDSIRVPLERRGKHYTLIDTAGIRRKSRVAETIEKFSLLKALKAVDACNVVIMVIDAQENVSEQDLHLLGYILDAGKSLIIAVNKWDGLDQDQRKRVQFELDRRLEFVSFAKIHFISALHGSGVGNLFDSVHAAYSSAMKKHSTNKLTKLLEQAVSQHPPPSIKGRRLKLRYAHMGGHNPPIIVIHGNQAERLSHVYKRYLINFYRKALQLVGTPIRIELNTTDNPYEHIKNKLTDAQVRKKRRFMKFVKKRK